MIFVGNKPVLLFLGNIGSLKYRKYPGKPLKSFSLRFPYNSFSYYAREDTISDKFDV